MKQGSTITWLKFKNASYEFAYILWRLFQKIAKNIFLAIRSIDCLQGNTNWNLQIPWFIWKWILWSCFFKKFYSISNQTEDRRQTTDGKWCFKILSCCYCSLKVSYFERTFFCLQIYITIICPVFFETDVISLWHDDESWMLKLISLDSMRNICMYLTEIKIWTSILFYVCCDIVWSWCNSQSFLMILSMSIINLWPSTF